MHGIRSPGYLRGAHFPSGVAQGTMRPMRTLASLSVFVAAVFSQDRPLNVVVIMADDVGVEAFGCYGGTSYETPRIDRMAAEGVRFRHCYSQPLCTPSRVKIMTGVSNLRNYVRFSVLAPDQVTFAHRLQRGGYRTAVVGKWQLYAAEHYGDVAGTGVLPEDAGFHEHCLWQVDKLGPRYPNPRLRIDGKDVSLKGRYGPDVFTERACGFIKDNAARPFLLYFPMALVHNPFKPTPDVPAARSRQQCFAAMMRYMDACVGRIMDAVKDAGVADRTLVLFTSDNGTNRKIVSMMGSKKVKGGKGRPNDRGTGVPLVAWGPGVVKGGRVLEDLVEFSDFMPTLLDAGRIDAPDDLVCDGVSFLPQLRGERGQPRSSVFIWSDPRPGKTRPVRFARDQRFKLYGDGRLLDVMSDPEETRPVSVGASEAADRARALLQAAMDRMPSRPARTIKDS